MIETFERIWLSAAEAQHPVQPTFNSHNITKIKRTNKNEVVAGYALSRFYALKMPKCKRIQQNMSTVSEEEDDTLYGNSLALNCPEDPKEQFWFTICLPISICLKYTIPDVR